MKKEPSAETMAVWTRLIRAGVSVRSAVEAALKKAGLPQLEWYDVLLEIERRGDEGIRPIELMDELLLPQYSLSRLLGRMDKGGLIRRDTLKGDARGQIIFLTREGAKTRKDMWPVYGAALQENIGEKLDISEALRLGQYLQRLSNTGQGTRF